MADKLKSFYKLLNDYIEKKDGLKDQDKEKTNLFLVTIYRIIQEALLNSLISLFLPK